MVHFVYVVKKNLNHALITCQILFLLAPSARSTFFDVEKIDDNVDKPSYKYLSIIFHPRFSLFVSAAYTSSRSSPISCLIW